MTNLIMFCLSLNPNHLAAIKKLNYIPVGLGEQEFNSEWETDKAKQHISEKNSFYGEYTFHYKLWKNNILNENSKWIGFCQYRKFFINDKNYSNNLSFNDLKNLILKNISSNFDNYDVIIGEEFFTNKFKLSKFIKKNFSKMIKNPSLFLNKKKRNIKFHFNMMHGDGNLDKAISLLDKKEKNDFIEFVNNKVSFNPHNMFVCRNKSTLMSYYDSLFPWLQRCEKIFGFSNLEGYGLKRIYGFLAERYMSYWFKKYTKCCELPILFKDIGDYDYKNL